MGHLLEAKL
jgi:hypothetical protein